MRHDSARMVWTRSTTSADFVENIVHASTKALFDKRCVRNDDDRCPAPFFTAAQRLPVPRRRSRKRNPDLNHVEKTYRYVCLN